MVPTCKMCDKHLLGEHVEIHMFVGTIKKGISIDGYIKNDLLEPKSIYLRHEEISKEMKKRGFNHKSPLPKISFSSTTIKKHINHKVNKKKSYDDLLKRCKNCTKLKNNLFSID